MIFGAITNSWREQLASHTVKELVHAAVEKGAKHIELRQTCLGECEEGAGENWRPKFDQLQDLVQAYPGLTFDLAMALPCLTQSIDPHGELWTPHHWTGRGLLQAISHKKCYGWTASSPKPLDRA